MAVNHEEKLIATNPIAYSNYAIDEIVAPGVTVNPVDNSYGDFELRADQRRR